LKHRVVSFVLWRILYLLEAPTLHILYAIEVPCVAIYQHWVVYQVKAEDMMNGMMDGRLKDNLVKN
jgi:hypothetical protein